MKQDQVEEFIKALYSLSPQEHAKVFLQIKEASYDRLVKAAEIMAVEARELSDFVKARLS